MGNPLATPPALKANPPCLNLKDQGNFLFSEPVISPTGNVKKLFFQIYFLYDSLAEATFSLLA
jgi:hypothetical protein